MNKRRLIIFMTPLLVFLLMSIFLYSGLFSDPRKLESVLIGKPVPEFQLVSLQDEARELTSADLPGEPFLLNVWATWCPTCYAEHEFLNQLSGQDITIVGINYKDETDKARQWLTQLKDPYLFNINDPRGVLGLELGVTGAPETFFVDSNGVIQHRHTGDLNADNWRNELAQVFYGME